MALLVLRCALVVGAVSIGVVIINSTPAPHPTPYYPLWVMGGSICVALAIVVVDILSRRKRVEIISAVYFGLLVGLLLAYVADSALSPLLSEVSEDYPRFYGIIRLMLAGVLCYVCISLLIQTKDEFRFIIPYVEFSKEVKGHRPYLLDTSVVIDGRIADVVETNVLDSRLIMPQFVIAELQAIADSSDRMRRNRGRRGLDILNRLRSNPQVDLVVDDTDLPELAGQPVDLKLVLLAKHTGGKVITNDFNLNKVAQIHGVGVINLNEIANALKPVFAAGESIGVRIIKAGEEPGQGVGYLDDGTMIVVEGGRQHVGRDVQITVTSILQTNAGRMVFGKYEGPIAEHEGEQAAG